MNMQSQKVHNLLVILSVLFALADRGGAAPPEGSSQGGHGGAMQGMPGGSSQEMPMGGGRTTAPQAPIRLSPEQRQMIGVTYGTVERAALKKTIRAVGRIDFDERRLADVTFKINGWVQDLFVDYTGKTVRKGEPLL